MTVRLLAVAIAALILPSMASADCGRAIKAEPACHVDSPIIGCITALAWVLLLDDAESGNADLFQRSLTTAVRAGECELFPRGIKLWRGNVTETASGEFVEIRKASQPKIFMIPTEMLNQHTSPANQQRN